jgi:hypothetical protein
MQVAQEALKIPGLLVEVYGDLARPGVKQVGKALETIIGLGNTILWPIALVNEKSRVALESNLKRYSEKMASVSEEKVVGVAPEIGVPIAEKLTYVADKRLSALYVNLLAKASNLDTVGEAHPSFVGIINNLSPDEALLLESFLTSPVIPFVSAKVSEHPKEGFAHLCDAVIDRAITGNLTFPENLEAYLANLVGLGIITMEHDEYATDYVEYDSLERQAELMAESMHKVGTFLETPVVDTNRGLVRITMFGWGFINACHSV